MRFGPLEIVIVAVVILIIFGATRMKNVGKKLAGGGSGSSSSGSAGGTISSAGPARATAKKSSVRHPRLLALGFLVLFGGALLLGLSFININALNNEWAVWVGGAIIFLGAALIIISRQR